MVAWWWVIPAVVGLLGLIVLFSSLRGLFSGRVFSGGLGTLFGGGVIAVAVAAALLGMNIQTYARLTYERPIATVDLRLAERQLYEVTVIEPGNDGEGGKARTYALQGDEWRMEAHVLKWKPWANVLGLDAQYRLDRLSGRYNDIDQEVSKPPSIHDLSGRPALQDRDWWDLDVFEVTRKYNRYVGAIDTIYGSGVYMPMADGARYEVWLTQSGLIARPANAAAMAASAGGWRQLD